MINVIDDVFNRANKLLDEVDWKISDSTENCSIKIISDSSTVNSLLYINNEEYNFDTEYNFPKDSILFIECKKENYVSYKNRIFLSESQSLTIKLKKKQIQIKFEIIPDNTKIEWSKVLSDFQILEGNVLILDAGDNLKFRVSKENYITEFRELYNLTENKIIKIIMAKEKFLVTVKVNDPSDATVKINGTVGNQMEIEDGSNAKISVEREGYETVEEEITVTKNVTKEYSLKIKKFTLRIGTTPENAKVTLNGEETREITCDYDTDVIVKVEAENYKTYEETINVNKDIDKNIVLEVLTYNVTVKGVGKTAEVIIDGNKTKVDTPVAVEHDKEIKIEVTQTGYKSYEETIVVTKDIEITIENWRKPYVEVNSIGKDTGQPVEGTVTKLNGIVISNGTTKDVNYGSKVKIEITAPGYEDFIKEKVVEENWIIACELIPIKQDTTVEVTLKPNVDDVKLTVEIGDEVIDKSTFTVEKGTSIKVKAEKVGYKVFGKTIIVEEAGEINIELEKIIFEKFIINTIPTDTVVGIRYNKESEWIKTKELINIEYGTKVYYIATLTGYIEKSGEFEVTENNIEIALKKDEEPEPAEDITARIKEIILMKNQYSYLAIGRYISKSFSDENLKKFYHEFKPYVIDKYDMELLKLLEKKFG